MRYDYSHDIWILNLFNEIFGNITKWFVMRMAKTFIIGTHGIVKLSTRIISSWPTLKMKNITSSV